MGQALVPKFIDRPAPPKHTIVDKTLGNKMHFCSLFSSFSLRFCSFKPTPSLLINIGKPDDPGSDSDRSSIADASAAATASSSGIQPPSSHAGRQSVVLYPLDEPPILAFVTWESYEATMTEIAHHFARNRADFGGCL